MEPLLLAVWILTGHHFAKGRTPAVTILRLFGIVEEVVLLGRVELRCIHFLLLSLEDLLLWFFFVFVLEFVGQHGLVFEHLVVELI